MYRYFLGFEPSFREYGYTKFLFGFGFYAFPYLFAVGLYSYFYQKTDFLLKKGFWKLSGLIIFVLYANQYLLVYREFLIQIPYDIRYFTDKVAFNLHSVFFYVLIPWLYWKWDIDARKTKFYGCTTKGFVAKTYIIMLLIMLPLLFWASFQKEFLIAYPRYKPGMAENYWQIPYFYTISAYELSYVLQFVALEIFFRGFIVMSLGRYMGSGAVFPMVAVYAFMHFFKPMPETIGSVFGGYILGVIAYYSRSVYGGMWIHIGIALMMELLAFFQLYWVE